MKKETQKSTSKFLLFLIVSGGRLDNKHINIMSDEVIFCRNARYHSTAQYRITLHCTSLHCSHMPCTLNHWKSLHITSMHSTALTCISLTEITLRSSMDRHNAGKGLPMCTVLHTVYMYNVHVDCTISLDVHCTRTVYMYSVHCILYVVLYMMHTVN